MNSQQGWRTSVGITQLGGLSYQGTWNADTNTPTITSGDGNTGEYYVVDVAGNTNVDGITDWEVGDWIIFNGTAWQKIDNTDQVSSVNGLTGAVSVGLESVLGQNNQTGANDISIDAGQVISFNVGSGGSLNSASTTSIQSWSLPDQSGVIALTSDLDDVTLQDVFDNSNQGGGYVFATTESLEFEDDGGAIYLGSRANRQLILKSTDLDNSIRFGASFNDNNILVTGVGAFKGVSYNADYSANFTNRSLVDKGYVDSAVSANNELSEILANGNTTGANNIVVDNGQEIQFVTSDSYIKGVDVGSGQILMTLESNRGIELINGGDNSRIGFTALGGNMSVEDGGSQKDFQISANNGQIVYSDGALSHQGILDFSNITSSPTWTLQDASGTIAFTSDIVTETLAQTLSAGNTTGGTNIVVSNGDIINFGGNGSISYDPTVEDAIAIDVSAIDSFFAGDYINQDGLRVDSGGTVSLQSSTGIPQLRFVGSGSNLTLTHASLSLPRTLTLPDQDGTIAVTTDWETGQAYTITNQPTADRAYDANNYTLDEIVAVLSTLIADLKTVNIIS